MSIPRRSKHTDKPWSRQDLGKFKDLKASKFRNKEAKKTGESQIKLCHAKDYAKIM